MMPEPLSLALREDKAVIQHCSLSVGSSVEQVLQIAHWQDHCWHALLPMYLFRVYQVKPLAGSYLVLEVLVSSNADLDSALPYAGGWDRTSVIVCR